MANIGHPTPGLHYSDPVRGLHDVAIAVQRAMQGKLNNAGSVTLTANAASTDVVDERVGANSTICFTPTTSNAAAEVGNGTMYVSSKGSGTFTITHADNAQTDRDFDFLLCG